MPPSAPDTAVQVYPSDAELAPVPVAVRVTDSPTTTSLLLADSDATDPQ